jgi:hypothetical protein
MKMLLITGITCLASLLCATEPARAGGAVVPTYELYSWQGPKGGWNFRLLYTTNRQKTVQEVFSKKNTIHGVQQLKTRLSRLPLHSSIVWFDRLTLSGKRVKGSESLKYPPDDVIEELKEYAAKRKIEISGPEHGYPQS